MTEEDRKKLISAAGAEYDAAFLESEELSVMNEAMPQDSPGRSIRTSGCQGADDDETVGERLSAELSAELSDIIMRAERLRDELPPV